MSSLVLFDLDLMEDDEIQEAYERAKDTIKYLEDLTQSIEKRVLKGEKIKGFKIVKGRSTRSITPAGENYLAHILGEEKFYERKPIGITKLEEILYKEQMDFSLKDLENEGYIVQSVGKDKVVLEKE